MNETATKIDVVERFRQWVDAGRPPLTVDDTAMCAAGVKEECCDGDDHGWGECLKPSRYIVERSDFDASFGELGGGAEATDLWTDNDLFALDDAPEEISPATAERFARYRHQRNGGHLTPRQIRRLVRKCRDNGLCRRLCDDGTHCFLPWDHKGLCESSTGLYAPWLRDPYEGEHSPADEYLIYPADRTCYGDTYAY